MTAIALLVALQTPQIETFIINGDERQAAVIAPADTSKPVPVVFVFHGHGGNMRQARRSFGIDRLWPEAVVVYGQGLPTVGMTDPEGKKNGWQKAPGEYKDRDLAYFDALLSSVKKKFKIDPRRIYAMGHSNGGRFTYVLWSARGDTFAALSPSASPGTGLIRTLKPVPAFIVAGEKDQLVSFASQKLTIDAVRLLLKTDSSKAKVHGYTCIEPGPDGLELGTYIYPGTHTYPREAAGQTVEFFRRHRKQ